MKSENLKGFALTDHDSIMGHERAAKAASELDLEFVPGVEISAIYGILEIHILGYGLDTSNGKLMNHLKESAAYRFERVKLIINKLASMGYNLPEDEVVGYATDTIGRPHLARAMVNHNIVEKVSQAFNEFLGKKLSRLCSSFWI